MTVTPLRRRATRPASFDDLGSKLMWIRDGLRAVRASTAVPASRTALAVIIDEVEACRAALPVLVARTQPAARPGGRTSRGAQTAATEIPRNGPIAKNQDGRRFCPRHNDGQGAWLPVDAFDKKGSSGLVRWVCRDCYSQYQRERYVAANKQAIILEVVEGDRVIGATCNGCGKPIELGQLIAATVIRHQECLTVEVVK